MSEINTHIISNFLENKYSESISIQHRKKYAQFFTPFSIAELMVKWLLGNPNLTNVLEPAFGLGIFSRILLNQNSKISIKGFEIDQNIYQNAKEYFSLYKNVNLILDDYMYNDWDNKYDGIICNPPYFKFHDYDNKSILKEVEEKISYKFNGFTNLYTLFLIKSIYQLNKNGRSAYIVPSEFLNSDYGKQVKSYLIKSKTLRHIIVIDFEENVFDDALTTACILLLSNDDNSNTINFSYIKSISELNQIYKFIEDYPNNKEYKQVALNQINPDTKWRSYYQEQNSIKYKHLVPFTKYGKVVRGIATGANEYFTFNLSKAQEHNINKKYLLPCICKATDIKSSFFTKNNFEELEGNDRFVYLLNAINPIDKCVKIYLELGLKEGVNKKYLTANRNPWYSLENRPPAPIWVPVFNRNGLRFIRNEANVSNLTTFHCIYIDLLSLHKIDLLFAYLLTDLSKEIFDDNRREYGNGLKKFEPNDINNSNMINLDIIKPALEKDILRLYNQYKKSEINRTPEYDLLDKINQLFVNLS